MAKLNAPLFSFNASGQLAKSLVYFGWKGLDLVRSYVTPSNPKTAGQTTQRGYLRDAVDALHAALALALHPFDADDMAGYAALASVRASPRTWFNEVCKNWIDTKVLGNTPVIFCDWTVSDPTANSIDLISYIEEETPNDLAAATILFGTSKTALIHGVALAVTPGATVALVASDCSAFLTPGERYYCQIRADAADPCEGAVSGIYSFIAS